MRLALRIGVRYLLTAKGDRFVSFISLVSTVGVGLGVAALIVVMAVMNGFQEELRDRILSVQPHVEALAAERGALDDWRAVEERIMGQGEESIVGIAPNVTEQGLLARKRTTAGTMVKGVLPGTEERVSTLGGDSGAGLFSRLAPGEYRLLLGEGLAKRLGAATGDRLLLIAPQVRVTPAGLLPRVRQFEVVGTFETGVHQYDQLYAYAHLRDLQALYGHGESVGALQIRLGDLFDAPRVSRVLNAAGIGGVRFTDWTRRHRSLFRALAVEKRVMFVILSLIIAVAAFNIVTALVTNVRTKRGDIAILRTFGAGPGSIVSIFVVQGALIGLVGIALGIALGLAVAANIDTIMDWVEGVLGTDLFPSDVYILDRLPARVDWEDVTLVSAVAFALSFLATLYPSLRAARVMPSEALRHE